MISIDADLSSLKYDANGLICAVVQHAGNGNVLMVAYMNKESLELTVNTGRAHFFSRSRQELWLKGETSGNYINVVDIRKDCDADALLILANPDGPSCHTGDFSCFGDAIPFDGYAIDMLESTILERKNALEFGSETGDSYTVKLLKAGKDRILRKLGEEATETIIASKNNDRIELVNEVSDLLYHLMVLLGSEEVDFSEVTSELYRRHGIQHGLPKTRV